jgi:hypothetical protein
MNGVDEIFKGSRRNAHGAIAGRRERRDTPLGDEWL